MKSTTKAAQGLYEYDAVSRLRDSQLGEERVHDVRNYIRKGPLWRAFEAEGKVVLLIDEIDKADIEFPNDLLQELDRMEFFVYETGETVRARTRPIVIITSNNEKELPDAFLRRCFFHYIRFPDEATLTRIVEVHFPRHQAAADPGGADAVLRDPRDAGAEEEALDLGGARLAEAACSPRIWRPRTCGRRRRRRCRRLHGALLKNEQDVHLFERLAFMARGRRDRDRVRRFGRDTPCGACYCAAQHKRDPRGCTRHSTS